MDSLSERMDGSITVSQVQDLLYSSESELKEIMGNELVGVARVQAHLSQVSRKKCAQGNQKRAGARHSHDESGSEPQALFSLAPPCMRAGLSP